MKKTIAQPGNVVPEMPANPRENDELILLTFARAERTASTSESSGVIGNISSFGV